MNIRKGFYARKVAGRYVAVAVGKTAETFKGIVNLNESGKFLWDQLNTPKTEEELLQIFMSRYEISEETAKTDLREFLDVLNGAGILE